MTAANTEIVEMFESLSMTPEQICVNTGYEISAVKAVLLQFSRVYRQVTKGVDASDEHITNDELVEAYEAVKEVMRYGENEGVKLKAACRLIDERKGRLDMVDTLRSTSINITIFNQQILAAREAKDKALRILQEAVA